MHMNTDQIEGAGYPPEAEGASVTAPEAASGTEQPEEARTLHVQLGGVDYTVSHSPDQWRAWQRIIPPKPVTTDTTAAQVTADHIQAVQNVGDLVLNEIAEVIAQHDCRKLHQTQEEHHAKEPHHWPLDGFHVEHGYLPVAYVVEALCDYIATVYGRAFAGREMAWLSPTNPISAGDTLTAAYLQLVDKYHLATVTPALPTLGGEADA